MVHWHLGPQGSRGEGWRRVGPTEGGAGAVEGGAVEGAAEGSKVGAAEVKSVNVGAVINGQGEWKHLPG